MLRKKHGCLIALDSIRLFCKEFAMGLSVSVFGRSGSAGLEKKRVIVAGGAVWGKRKYRFLRRV